MTIEAALKACASKADDPTKAEAARRLHSLLDQLRWFYENGIAVSIAPKAMGWTLKLTVRKEAA